MDDLDFFRGDNTHRFVAERHGGKVRLSCSLIERWEEKLSRSLNCGMARTYNLKKRLGVTSVERTEVESTVTSTFGKTGILELKSEIKGKLGRELHLEESEEEEEEFTIQAPNCGRVTLRVYQFMRQYDLTYEDRRFWLWRKKNFSKTFTEWLNYIYDRSVLIDIDPACNCKPAPDSETEGLVTLFFGTTKMLAGYKHTSEGIELPTANAVFKGQTIEDVLFKTVSLDCARLPSHILFLAGEQRSRLTVRLLPYERERLIGEGVARERDYDRQPRTEREYVVQERRAKVYKRSWPARLFALIVGAGLGGIAALLLAPEAGRELRARIAKRRVGVAGENARYAMVHGATRHAEPTYDLTEAQVHESAIIDQSHRSGSPRTVVAEPAAMEGEDN